MPKYFVDVSVLQQEMVKLEGDTAHHLERVLRVRVGDEVILGDNLGFDYHCRIESIKPLMLRIEERKICLTESSFPVTLYQGVPKSQKLELIIQKATELGVSKIVPVYTEHSVVKDKHNSGGGKLARLQKIAESAAGQSMRGFVPEVGGFMTWAEIFGEARNDINSGICSDLYNEGTHKRLKIAAHEKEDKHTIKSVMEREASEREASESNLSNLSNSSNSKSIDLWIGPEGGFSASEIDEMLKCGFHLVSLGPRILRTETAAIAALAQIMLMM